MTIDWSIVFQTALLLVAIVASFMRLRERITELETTVRHLDAATKPIPGISRAVARLEGRLEA